MTEPELLEPAAARAANPHLRGLGSSSCPYGECDGNGLVLEDSGDARACRCRAERIARNRTRGLHDTIPERYRDLAFERAPVNQMEQQTVRHIRRFCERIESKLDDGKGFFFFGDRGTGKTTLAMLIAQHALQARGARSRSITSPWLLSQIRSTYEQDAEHSYVEPHGAAGGGRPAAARRHGSGQPDGLDARAALHDREPPLRGPAVGRRHRRRSTAPRGSASTSATRTASRLFEMCETIPLFGAGQPRLLRSSAPEA